eukprot:222793_1
MRISEVSRLLSPSKLILRLAKLIQCLLLIIGITDGFVVSTCQGRCLRGMQDAISLNLYHPFQQWSTISCPGIGRGRSNSSLKVTADTLPSNPLDVTRIRNFCILAHIDHGKSTLADRLLEFTGAVEKRQMRNQFLDSMDLERERGITIKLNAAKLTYVADDGLTYQMNLIDTPGHVDFSYEVSRSLNACEGALLVVDSLQGVEAQTLANCHLAIENNLEIIPVLNKVDLPSADPIGVSEEIESAIGLDCTSAIYVSAKTGLGVKELLETIVKTIPSPPPPTGGPLRALIYDSFFHEYRGVVVYVRIVDGSIKVGDRIIFMSSKSEHEVLEVGVRTPDMSPVDELMTGEVGYMVTGVKNVRMARVGDTITLAKAMKDGSSVSPVPGYIEAKPMVFSGLYPTDSGDYQAMRESLGKLKLNDAALSYEPENSFAMGFGFRCGFLGLLHMEIIQERLEREYDLDLIVSAPSVVYRAELTNGEVVDVQSPHNLPDPTQRVGIMEPFTHLEILTPPDYTGPLMDLCQSNRGEFIDMKFLSKTRTSLQYHVPLAEVISGMFDEVKSRSKGYASMEYMVTEFRRNDLVRLDVRINGEDAGPLASICHRDQAYARGKALTEKLKELIPRQQFKISIQACIGAKPIASSTIPTFRKDVTAKCYGGDITRKKKLLKKQTKGKKRMRSIGKVNVPQEALMAILDIGGGGKV